MQRVKSKASRSIIGALCMFFAISALTAGGCDGDPTPQQNEAKIKQGSYNRLTKQEPAKAMAYSPTRKTINFWIETWDNPGKLSYVYLQASNGELIGYYVLKGLPVSYCAALTPTYEFVDTPDDDSNDKNQQVPAPSVDGVYYGNSGALCGTYYGEDATTGAYIEYTVGNGQNVLLYDRPLPRQDVKPLGYTEVKNGKPVKGR